MQRGRLSYKRVCVQKIWASQVLKAVKDLLASAEYLRDLGSIS